MKNVNKALHLEVKNLHLERSNYFSFFHTTPLALWRGVGGEALILHFILIRKFF